MSGFYRGTAFNHIADLAMALANLAKRVVGHEPPGLRQIELDLLRNLGVVVRNAMAAEDDSKTVVREIAAMVSRYSGGARPRNSAGATLH
jgi:hypothetical protein